MHDLGAMYNLFFPPYVDDNEGREHKFELVKKASIRWREIGLLLGFELDGWEDQYCGNAEWLAKPASWTVLFHVLEDIGCPDECAGSPGICIDLSPYLP